MPISQYVFLICASVGPEIATFTGLRVPKFDPMDAYFQFRQPELLWLRSFPDTELYRYMAYLRHHGFPSPLLDWSRSLYVATFFAFRDQTTQEPALRSIYVCWDAQRGSDSQTVGKPTIRRVGSYVATHQRHFRQQCDYTICAAFDKENEQWRFDSHDAAFHDQANQHYLWRIDIPSEERTKVLNY